VSAERPRRVSYHLLLLPRHFEIVSLIPGGRAEGSFLVLRPGYVRAPRADTSDMAVPIWVTVAGEQVSAHVAVGLRT
jgi:hypothetical protein